MGFLSPWFLAGSLAVALPLWLHLLRQHKSVPLPFSSLMFFERRTQSSIKHRRLRYLLLLALRILLLLLLALAFANPFIQSSGAFDGSKSKLLVLAVDNSFSMRQGNRLERAKQEAVSTLSVLRPATDRAQVMAIASGVVMMSEAGADLNTLRAAVQAVPPSDGLGSYVELARALRSIAQAARIPVEAHLFSDMQKSSWPPNFADTRLGDQVKLILHPVTDRRLPNFAVETVSAPRRIYDPKKVRIQATLAGYGTERATKRVTLLVNGKEMASKPVEIAAGGRASVEFLTLDAGYGLNRGQIRLDPPDAFPDDDRFNFSAERSDPRRVLFLHEGRNQRGVLYFRTALDAASDGAFVMDAVHSEQAAGVQLSKYALVVLSDLGSLPSGFEDSLKTWVRGGGSVWISLGRFAGQGQRVPVFDEAILESRYSAREGERFRAIAWFDPAHASFRGDTRWDAVKFYQSIRVEPGKARVLAKLTDDTPLVLEKQIGEGRALVFTSTFDNIANDFPLHASFVPFVVETSRHLGRLDEGSASLMVGAHVELRSAAERGAAVEVLDPAGRRALTLEEGAKALSLALTAQGFWDVRRPSGRHELVAVNADRRESDLEVLSAETLALWQNTGQGSPQQGNAGPGAGVEPEKKPLSFWWYLMLAALLLSVAETVVGNRHLAVEKGDA
ncbi:MAG: BatA domain-containing protein [Candidatus Solibacter usitatus]|nr:BatA domain-containing protein [Candidatus Solibacter usitatus]